MYLCVVDIWECPASAASKRTPKPNISKSPSSLPDPSSTNTSGMPMATSIATSQADFDRLKPQSSQPPVGPS